MRHSSMCRGESYQFLVGHARITRKTLGFVIILMALLQFAHRANVANGANTAVHHLIKLVYKVLERLELHLFKPIICVGSK